MDDRVSVHHVTNSRHHDVTPTGEAAAGFSGLGAVVLVIGWWVLLLSPAGATHHGAESHAIETTIGQSEMGYPVSGVSFLVVLSEGTEGRKLDRREGEAAVRTVIDALQFMLHHRTDYPRFDESVKKEALAAVVIEPHVVNQDGKEFPFLVARTTVPGRVKLLINAASLKAAGLLHQPEQLVPALAREFQWVVSKSDTAPKPAAVSVERDPARAPVRTDAEIAEIPGDVRGRILARLFQTYLRTTDDFHSLDGQPYYEVGTTTLVPPAQPDSTTKLYDIRVREALQKIVREPYYAEHTPMAVRSLLNGKIWTVAFVKVDQRDWATRTRVLPEDKAVVVGERGRAVQPAAILVNLHRRADPDDPFFRDTAGLPMGALSADQLGRVIAWEIESNIVEKSMRGHVAQDEQTAPN